MKLRLFILVVFLAVLAWPALPQQANVPLGKDQVLDLVKYGMDSAELAKRIKEHGIDFEPAEEYLETLRKAGAQDVVIQALREVRPKPLTREQVGKLVAGGVPSERAAALVKQHGIDFVADERYLETLRLAGADDTLIAALREASKAVTAELVVTTSPNAGVSLDGALQGQADWLGKFVVKVGPGTHVVAVSLAGKRNFVQTVTLVTRQTTYVQAPLVDFAEIGVQPAALAPSSHSMSLWKAWDSKKKTGVVPVTLDYPECAAVTGYSPTYGGLLSHDLKESDLRKSDNMTIHFQISGCTTYLHLVVDRVDVGVMSDNSATWGSGWFFVGMPMSLWVSATHLELKEVK
jgi:hypothetical protein